MKPRIAFHWIDDETCHIEVDGRKTATAEHGPHGWDGMEGIIEAVADVAAALGVLTQTIGEPGV